MKHLITSTSNPAVKQINKLRKSRERLKNNLFLIDGELPLERALGSSIIIKTIYYDISRINTKLNEMAEKKGICIQPVSRIVSDKISFGSGVDGYTSIASTPDLSLSSLSVSPDMLIIITENLEKPGNIGAIIRSAEASGAHLHIACSPYTDIYNPNIIRNSRGAVFSLCQAVSEFKEAHEWLAKNKFRVFAARPGIGKNYTELDLRGPTAICIGNEHSGLSGNWDKAIPVQIKMKGYSDSLNAAQTATLLLFEALRQRELLT